MATQVQLSLFPTYDSLEQVMAEAKADLPITSELQLVALLQTHENTLIHLIESQETV
jgi:hypothetical protein